MVKNKIKPLNTRVQGVLLKRNFPESTVSYSGGRMVWKGEITPCNICNTYKVRISYSVRGGVDVFVLSPRPLPLAEDERLLPHTYDQKRQKLCLYYLGDWNKSEKIVDTILPWTAEWLFHYECWVATGEWKGGGIHRTRKKPIKKKE